MHKSNSYCQITNFKLNESAKPKHHNKLAAEQRIENTTEINK